jgi:hypothetical protein
MPHLCICGCRGQAVDLLLHHLHACRHRPVVAAPATTASGVRAGRHGQPPHLLLQLLAALLDGRAVRLQLRDTLLDVPHPVCHAAALLSRPLLQHGQPALQLLQRVLLVA